MTELNLKETLRRHLDDVDVPPARPGPVVAVGRRRRRRRRRLVGAVSVAAALAAAGGGTTLMSGRGSDGPDVATYAELGPLDLSNGARAYASPGKEVHFGSRTFPARDLEYLDTDAVATSYGIVFFDDGRPMLLGDDGTVLALVEGDLDAPKGFHPTAKQDSRHPWVAWATRSGGETTLTVYDLERGEEVASTVAPCGACGGLVIDAFDDGVAYVRMGEETQTWSSADGWNLFAGPGSRVVDVRNGVVLYDGVSPSESIGFYGYVVNQVEAPIDAQLTFDGRYVLDRSSRLRSTDGSPDLVLDQGPTRQQALGFWTIDSDGSVLVTRPDGYPRYVVYDCEVSTGACEELGPLVTKSGDPEFIGDDM